MTSPFWTLKMLGEATLSSPTQSIQLERKAAALLAYLAIEGRATRAKLADLLWPSTPERAARNNLVHLLRKLHQQTDQALVVGSDQLSLIPEISVDAHLARDSFAQGQFERFCELYFPLLQAINLDDCPELAEWLYSERERWHEWYESALREDSARLESSGQYEAALNQARVLLEVNPISEDAHRRIMRLHYLRGDRSEALRAFARCQEILQREMGVEPLRETTDLMQAIEAGTVRVVVPKSTKAVVPISVLRPPLLIGRESEWEQMEAAWTNGQFISIAGQAGAGKTRLMFDFVNSKVDSQHILYLQSRPGDAAVPYSTHARNFRKLIHQYQPDLEPWAVRELARIIPELGDPLPPIASESEKLRFYQAKTAALIGAAMKGMQVLISDDVQFTDPASIEASLFMMGNLSVGSPIRGVYCYRQDELDLRISQGFHQLADAGVGVIIQPEVLSEYQVEKLLSSLELPTVHALSAAMTRFTGGNPLFLLETVKHLVETDQLSQEWGGTMPPPGKVGPIIQRRLERLSSPALQAARAAAVLQSDFSVELIAQVLNAPLLAVATAWEELENAQMVSGERFSHDLVFETIRALIPDFVRGLLHRSVAKTLEQNQANPVIVANHWLAGGKPALALPHLKRAAQSAQALGLYRDAMQAWQQVLNLADIATDRLAAEQGLSAMKVVLEQAN